MFAEKRIFRSAGLRELDFDVNFGINLMFFFEFKG